MYDVYELYKNGDLKSKPYTYLSLYNLINKLKKDFNYSDAAIMAIEKWVDKNEYNLAKWFGNNIIIMKQVIDISEIKEDIVESNKLLEEKESNDNNQYVRFFEVYIKLNKKYTSVIERTLLEDEVVNLAKDLFIITEEESSELKKFLKAAVPDKKESFKCITVITHLDK